MSSSDLRTLDRWQHMQPRQYPWTGIVRSAYPAIRYLRAQHLHKTSSTSMANILAFKTPTSSQQVSTVRFQTSCVSNRHMIKRIYIYTQIIIYIHVCMHTHTHACATALCCIRAVKGIGFAYFHLKQTTPVPNEPHGRTLPRRPTPIQVRFRKAKRAAGPLLCHRP